jgi:NAD(P)-dependent dehydrogenase (short-subunit alcohol dehydrogenase family)
MRLADDIVAQGHAEPLLHAIDLAGAQAEDYAVLAELIATHAGQLDTILHLAADIGAPAPLAHVDPATWNRIMRVNLTAPFLLTRACLPLLHTTHGKVIFITDENPASYLGAYAISKAALVRQAAQWADEQPELCFEVFTPPAMPTALYARIYPGRAPDGLSPVQDVAQKLLRAVC